MPHRKKRISAKKAREPSRRRGVSEPSTTGTCTICAHAGQELRLPLLFSGALRLWPHVGQANLIMKHPHKGWQRWSPAVSNYSCSDAGAKKKAPGPATPCEGWQVLHLATEVNQFGFRSGFLCK